MHKEAVFDVVEFSDSKNKRGIVVQKDLEREQSGVANVER